MAQYDTVIGLDIGTHAVKAAWVKLSSGRPVVVRTEALQFPLDGSGGKAMIAPWAEKVGLRKYPCVLGMPGQQTMFQPFLLPPGDPRTEDQAAAMEVVKFNEMASETMTYGLAPFMLNPGERRILVAMARPSLIEALLATAEELHLDVIDIVPTPVAISTLFSVFGPGQQPPTVYVNMGRANTEVAVGSSAGLLFARTFASGGQLFTDTLATAQGTPRSRAEQRKLDEGSLDPATPLAVPLKKAADIWLSEAQSCLSVYRSLYQDRTAKLAKVVLTGGAARLPGLATLAAERFMLPVEIAAVVTGEDAARRNTEFAAAIGLALCVGPNRFSPITLLPDRLRDEQKFRRQKPYWIAAVVAAGLILVVSVVGGYRDFSRKARHLNEQRNSLQRRQKLVAEIEQIKNANAQLQEMGAPVRRLLSGTTVMRDLITHVAVSKDKLDLVTMIGDADSYFGTHPLAPPPADGAQPRRPDSEKAEDKQTFPIFERVLLEGYTRKSNLASVKELIAALQQAQFVASADLLSDDQLLAPPPPRSEGRGIPFVIDVKLKAP